MAALSATMALVMIAQGIAGLQWSPTSLQNNAVVYACAKGTLSLPWSVTVAPGDTIVDISWFVSGTSQEMIAAVTHGNFFAMPAFANRARQLANAGIEVDHVGVSETGNYTVEVAGHSAAGKFINLKQSVDVIVADGLQTTDGQLHVIQQQEAVYDVATDQFDVVFRCGTFIYPTHPAFDVTWETPSGLRSSSRYDNGSFYLRLDTPVQGGTYTCRLPPISSCVRGNDSALAVSVSVDKTEARLLLMEARQTALDIKNKELDTKNKELDIKNKELDTKNKELDTRSTALEMANTDLVHQNNALQAALQGLQGELNNRTNALENRVHAQGEENELLKLQLGSLYNSTNALENRVHVLGDHQNATEGLLTHTVSFHARLSRDSSYVYVAERSTLVLPLVLRNHGDGYDNTTGVFTAPYSGTYCFLATAASQDEANSKVYLGLNVNGVDVAYTLTKPGLDHQPATLHAVVALKAGETAYLYIYHHGRYWGYVTSFSGFLVDHTSN